MSCGMLSPCSLYWPFGAVLRVVSEMICGWDKLNNELLGSGGRKACDTDLAVGTAVAKSNRPENSSRVSARIAFGGPRHFVLWQGGLKVRPPWAHQNVAAGTRGVLIFHLSDI